MKSSIFLSLLLLMLCCNTIQGQSPIFKQEFDIPLEQASSNVHIATYDGGMMSVITSYSTLNSATYLTMVKTDAGGVIQWTNRFGPISPMFDNIVQASDSGYILVYTDFLSTSYTQVIRMDKLGNVIYSRMINAPSGFVTLTAPIAIVRPNGNVYVGSTLYDTPNSTYYWHLFELDAIGNIIWTHSYNQNSSKDHLADIDTCSNGDILLLGSRYDPISTEHCPMLTRAAPGGIFLWTKYYPYAGYDALPVGLLRMPGDYILILTASINMTTFNAKSILMRLNNSGNELWTFEFTVTNASAEPTALEAAENGNSVILASDYGDGLSIKNDTSGLVLCTRRYHNVYISTMDTLNGGNYSFAGYNLTNGHAVQFTSDPCGIGCDDTLLQVNKLHITATQFSDSSDMLIPITSVNNPIPNPFVTVHTLEVCSALTVPENFETPTVHLYPSPASEWIYISSTENISMVELLDVNGKVVRSRSAQVIQLTVPVGDLAAGIYFLRITSGDEMSIQKIVIQH